MVHSSQIDKMHEGICKAVERKIRSKHKGLIGEFEVKSDSSLLISTLFREMTSSGLL